jgi:hypothetical protein
VRGSAGPASIGGRLPANDANFLDLTNSPTGHRPCIENNRQTSHTDNFPFKEEQSARTASPPLLAFLACREHLRGALSGVLDLGANGLAVLAEVVARLCLPGLS